MRKLFVKTNGFNMVAFVDDNNMAYAIDCETLEEARVMDLSGIEGCETAEEIEAEISVGNGIFDFAEVENNSDNEIVEF